MSGLTHTQPLNVSPFIPRRISGRRALRRQAAAEPARPAIRTAVLGERLFRDAVVRERRRADRFEEGFVLVLVSLALKPVA